jgi:hypothetical protein
MLLLDCYMPPYICQFCGHKSSCKFNYYCHYNTHITPDNINTISKEDIELCMLYSNKNGLRQMKYYKNNKGKIREYKKKYNKEYCENNKGKIKEYRKEYNQNNREKLKEYREKLKEYKKKYDKEYRQNNKEKIKQRTKEYTQKNKERISEKNRKYYLKNKRSRSELPDEITISDDE